MENSKFLKNDYKVIYSAKRGEDEMALYGTKTIPSELDNSLIYVNDEGNELTKEEVKAIKLVYSRGEHIYYSFSKIPSISDHRFSGFNGDELVFGDEDIEPGEKFEVRINEITNCVITGNGKYKEGAKVEITLAPAPGYRFGEGNAPKCDKCEFTGSGNMYVGSFIMGAEKVTIEITDVVVERIPEPVKPKDAYWCACESLPTAIDSKFTAIAVASKPEMSVVFPGSENIYFPAFAVRKELGELVAVYQPAMPSLNILSDFAKSEVLYNGSAYILYAWPEEVYSENENQFDFCWAARS